MRSIQLTVGNKEVGRAKTWAYPEGLALGFFWIPTYSMKVQGKDAAGKNVERDFEVLRFGIHCPTKKSKATVVGLADEQVHIIKAWLPDYSVHSAPSIEQGAWQVYSSFLIHDGPDDKVNDVYASIGCIEVCGTPRGFDIFNDFLIGLSGATGKDRGAKLAAIGRSKQMSIKYLEATRPTVLSAP